MAAKELDDPFHPQRARLRKWCGTKMEKKRNVEVYGKSIRIGII